jgi:hypothetical protein
MNSFELSRAAAVLPKVVKGERCGAPFCAVNFEFRLRPAGAAAPIDA